MLADMTCNNTNNKYPGDCVKSGKGTGVGRQSVKRFAGSSGGTLDTSLDTVPVLRVVLRRWF